MEKIHIIWFRRDLRTEDNPILNFDFKFKILPIFIFDKNILEKLSRNDRRITYIFDQVSRLKKELQEISLDLAIFYGKPLEVLEFLSNRFEIVDIIASTDNDPYSKHRDNEISKKFNLNIIFDNFLINPETIKSKEGKIYTVFTHFKNAVKDILEQYRNYNPRKLSNKHILANYNYFDKIIEIDGLSFFAKPIEINSIGFFRQKIIFEGAIKTPKELLEELEKFVHNYDTLRNYPYLRGTSLLSTHLRFGSISIRKLLNWAFRFNAHSFISELIWREFFNYILFNFPNTITENLQKNVQIEWKNSAEHYERWKSGQTGIPLVDAGIRELIETGYMHNRVRMVVASFLTKNLLIDWKLGEEFFANYLFDYETSSNVGNWQWVAGVGTDPRSATRIFNPFLQSKKFDPDCTYIYKYVPELRNVAPENIHNPEFMLNNKVFGYCPPLIKDIKTSNLAFHFAYKRNK